jgi:hypothetical protein
VDPILRGEEKPKDLTDKMFQSAIASWFANFILVFSVLSAGIYALKQAR